MKKVGIISYWDSLSNYGQILQGSALQHVLKEFGYYPETIKYVLDNKEDKKTLPEKVHDWIKDDISLSHRIKRKVQGFSKNDNLIHEIYDSDHFLRERKFPTFKEKYLNLSQSEYKHLPELKEYSSDFHGFITGSDQVWHKTGGSERKRIFLLDFLSEKCKRISYAASFGRDKIINKKEFKLFQECLSKFDKVSVREDSGIKLCKDLGRNDVELMPDPAILLNKRDWINLLNLKTEKASGSKSVFCYSLTSNDERVHAILEDLKANGYTVNYVCSDSVVDELSNIEPTIQEWIEGICNADFVVTTSFHGTLFSLILNTPFISVGKKNNIAEGSNRRFYSILKQLNMLDHLVNEYNSETLNKLMAKSINWKVVNDHFSDLRRIGRDYITKNLS